MYNMSYTEIHEEYDHEMESLIESLKYGDISLYEYNEAVDELNDWFNNQMDKL